MLTLAQGGGADCMLAHQTTLNNQPNQRTWLLDADESPASDAVLILEDRGVEDIFWSHLLGEGGPEKNPTPEKTNLAHPQEDEFPSVTGAEKL